MGRLEGVSLSCVCVYDYKVMTVHVTLLLTSMFLFKIVDTVMW